MTYFTAVFKDLPADEMQAITRDERCRFMSHSHVGHERDDLRQRAEAMEDEFQRQRDAYAQMVSVLGARNDVLLALVN